MFALLADHERRVQTDPRTAGTAEEIVAMLAAMLTAPVPALAQPTVARYAVTIGSSSSGVAPCMISASAP